MNSLLRSAMSSALSFATARIAQFLTVALVAFVVFAPVAQADQTDRSLGEKTRDRIQQVERGTDRPKTVGEFKNEAREGIPLDERLHNITRDSAEAVQQFGKGYSIGAQESAQNVKDKAAQAGENLYDRVTN